MSLYQEKKGMNGTRKVLGGSREIINSRRWPSSSSAPSLVVGVPGGPTIGLHVDGPSFGPSGPTVGLPVDSPSFGPSGPTVGLPVGGRGGPTVGLLVDS